jgi:hypothetical protein
VVPNPFNPQDYNRFSYVRNNPVRYVDPSGHVCSDPEDPTPTCDGSFQQKTKVGNKMVQGTGLNAGKPTVKKKEKSDEGGTRPPLVQPDSGIPDPDAPVVIANPDPLDGGLQQDDPSLPFTQASEEIACPSCVQLGGVIIVLTGFLELVYGAATLYALSITSPIGLVFLPIDIVVLNILLVGIELQKQGKKQIW